MKRYCILILFTFLLSHIAFSQGQQLAFTHQYTISEGLPHNGVTSLLEDSKGYIWISTYDGLCRYNGYEFTTFKNDLKKDILSSNRIRCLAEDQNGNLWLGTDDGVTVLNYSDYKFRNINTVELQNHESKGPIIRKIIENRDKKLMLCISEKKGLIIYNQDFNFKKLLTPDKNIATSNMVFNDMFALDNNNYLLLYDNGILLFELDKYKFSSVLSIKLPHNCDIKFIDTSSLLITLTNGIGIIKFDKSKKQFQLLSTVFKNESFNSIEIDPFNHYWLGTYTNGIIKVDNLTSLLREDLNKCSFFTNRSGILRVGSITFSKNSCWVGTFNKGIYRFDIQQNPFKYYNSAMNYSNALRSSEVMSISVLDDDRIYLTANQGGLALFNTKSQLFEPLGFNLPVQNKNIGFVFVDSKKNIWLNLGIGIVRIKKGTKNIEFIHQDLPLLNLMDIKKIVEDNYGNIWIATVNNIYKLNLDLNGTIVNVEKLSSNPFFNNKSISTIRKIYIDRKYGLVWVGSSLDGLIRLDVKGNKSIESCTVNQYIRDKKVPTSISSNFVTSILRLSNDEFWIGTEYGGICKVQNSTLTPSFEPYSEFDGLSNNVVKDIIEGKDLNLWISTNIGLNKFDTKTKKNRKFALSDGLPFEDFLYASAKLKNGNLVFSGLNGICYFNPDDLANKEDIPRLDFGDLKVLNKTVLPGDTVNNRIILVKRLNEIDELVLKYNENVFSIELNSLHFSTTNNHYIRYKLSPIDEDWIEVTSDKRTINYSGLQSGKYKLKVSVSNALNNWSEPRELTIIIKPPFWRTGFAYFIYLLLIGLIIYAVVRINLRIQGLNHTLEIEQLEKDNEKNISDAKLRFFSNISHEIKTPLTLISGPVDLLAEQFRGNTFAKEKLNLVQRQLKKISQLITQVHDYQRSEAYLLKLNNSTFNFDNFIKTVVADFEFLAETDRKKIEIIAQNKNVYVFADKDKLEKVLNNLLNNAFKFTKANDIIKIEYKTDGKDLYIDVVDTGKGIDSEDLPFIFDRFFQSLNQKNIYSGGSGIGLAFSKRLVEMHYGYIDAESELEKGTTIHLRLPIVTDEVVDEDKIIEILEIEKKFDSNLQLVNKTDLTKIHLSDESKNATVFLVEDNTDMRLFVSELILRFYKVKVFVNGLECLTALDTEWPDIVVSDVLMPEMNGFDLCKKIKSDVKTSHIPVILLTACTTVNEHIQGVSVGADSYIEKPFDAEHLLKTVDALLINRKQLRERFQHVMPLTLEANDDNIKDMIFLEKLYKLMEDNLDNQDLDLDRFAKDLYLNRTHFYQKVKALTNYSPYELLKVYRLKKAAEMLASKKINVNEAAMMTGFKSRTHFSKLFKEMYDVTPGKFAEDAADENAEKKE